MGCDAPRSPVDPYPGPRGMAGSENMRSLVSLFHPSAKTLFQEGLVNEGGLRPNNMLLFAGLPFSFLRDLSIQSLYRKILEGVASKITDAKLCL